MYNYLFLIGTVTKDIELKELSDGKVVTNVELAITREFKNMDGGYDCDFIKLSLWGFLAEAAASTLSKGSRVGFKGRIYPHTEQLASGAYVSINELIAERMIYFDRLTNQETVFEEPSKQNN